MKRLLFFATTVLLAASCIEVVANENANAMESTVETTAGAAPKVYSNCYDGYLNVRAAPTSKSQILARLNNGSGGAELLGVEGTWSKVRVNGVVGYVSSKYLQSTPTDPVYIDASVVVGNWSDIGTHIAIKSNGRFVHTYGASASMSHSVEGTWRLSYNKLILKYSDGSVVAFTVNGATMENEDEEVFYKL